MAVSTSASRVLTGHVRKESFGVLRAGQRHRTEASSRLRKVAVIIGTRPEAVKLAPVVQKLEERPWARPITIATGQHPRAVVDVLGEFGLDVDHLLHLPRCGTSLSQLLGMAMDTLGPCLEEVDPDLVLVQGDTTSTLAGALAGFLVRTPVVHLEAGLRSGRLDMPFPEEGTRRAVSALAVLHLAPTHLAARQLLAVGIPEHQIVITGNTSIDAVEAVCLGQAAPISSRRRQVLVTAHRRESWDGGVARVGEAVSMLASQWPDVEFAVVTHLNGHIAQVLSEACASLPNIRVLKPMSYHAFVALLRQSSLVVTDSGGLQEEAPALGVPVLVTRDVTERPEGLAVGCTRLVGTQVSNIVAAANLVLSNPAEYASMAEAGCPFGDGLAAERAVAACGWFLGQEQRPASLGDGAVPTSFETPRGKLSGSCEPVDAPA